MKSTITVTIAPMSPRTQNLIEIDRTFDTPPEAQNAALHAMKHGFNYYSAAGRAYIFVPAHRILEVAVNR